MSGKEKKRGKEYFVVESVINMQCWPTLYPIPQNILPHAGNRYYEAK